jgi:hypothetical protein
MELIRKLPPGLGWLSIGAALVGVDALALDAAGHHTMASIGYILVLGTMAFAIVFCDWRTDNRRR